MSAMRQRQSKQPTGSSVTTESSEDTVLQDATPSPTVTAATTYIESPTATHASHRSADSFFSRPTDNDERDNNAHTAARRRSSALSFLRFLPLVIVFFSIFIGFSYVTTGTLNYSAGPIAGVREFALLWRQTKRYINDAKIRLQTFAGLRKATKRRREEEGGYGGVHRSSNSKGREGQSPPVAGASGKRDGQIVIAPRPAERDPTALYLTLEQLSEFTGADGGTILLAVYGRIFDVTEGAHHYGPQGPYRNLAGKDASRAFATNCYNNQQLYDVRGLTAQQRKSIDHWYNFYNTHPIYSAVGWVDLPEIAADAPLPNDVC